MINPSQHFNRLYIYLFLLLALPNISIANEQTYVREYTYQASEADSKLSARAIALQEVKRILLSELGTHVSSLVKQLSSSDGTYLGTEEIETLSAGVTRVEILDEKWNGMVYVLKAQIKADPSSVLKSLQKILDADKKQKQISQLGSDISKMRTENIKIADSLTQAKNETNVALTEIARLRKQLEQQQTETSRLSLQNAYKQQTDQLMLYEWFESALKYYEEGDYSEALRLYKKAAEQGYAPAQHNLGSMYYNGEGALHDAKLAVYWFQKAAEQGLADSQSNLATMYAKGEGVLPDEKQAVYWLKEAAVQGLAVAQVSLGVRYIKGEGVERNAKLAVYWFLKAAEQGNANAEFSLGNTYANGEVVPPNNKQAAYWYKKAADHGLAVAQVRLGLMYDKGEGVNRDLKQSLYWLRKAAEQGNDMAQTILGMKYDEGDGVIRDKKQAVYWLKKAAEQGHPTARALLRSRQ